MKKAANLFFGIFYLLGLMSLYQYFFIKKDIDSLYVGLSFLGIFGFLHFGLFKIFNHYEKRKANLDKYKDELWRWRKDWRSRYSRPEADGKVKIIVFSVFFILFALLSFPVMQNEKFQRSLESGDLKYIFIYFFPVIAVYCLIGTLWQWNVSKKFQSLKLLFQQDYFFLGDEFSSELILPKSLRLSDKIKCRLSCDRVKLEKTGSKNETRRENIWSHTWEQTAQSSSMLNRVKIKSKIPSDLPETMPYQGIDHPTKKIKILGKEYPVKINKGIEWFLEVDSEMSGADLSFRFEIPVFKSGDVLHLRATRDQVVADEVETKKDFRFLIESMKDLTPVIDIRTSDSIKVGFLMMLMGLIFLIPGLWIFYSSIDDLNRIDDFAKILFGGVFSFIGGIIFLFSFDRFSLRGQIQFMSNSFQFQRLTLFGLRSFEVNYKEIKSVKLKSIFSINHKNFYDILIYGNMNIKKKRRVLKICLPSEFEARYLKKLIKDRLI